MERTDENTLQYYPLVHDIARRVLRKYEAYVELDDLISSGTIGLIDAIEKYDPTLKVKFSTYAKKRILGAMIDEMRQLDFVSRYGRENGYVAFFETRDKKGGDIHEYMEQGTFPDPFDALLFKERMKCVAREMMTLDQRGRRLLELIYDEGKTFKQAGYYYGITESRVSQIHDETCAVLRRRLAWGKEN